MRETIRTDATKPARLVLLEDRIGLHRAEAVFIPTALHVDGQQGGIVAQADVIEQNGQTHARWSLIAYSLDETSVIRLALLWIDTSPVLPPRTFVVTDQELQDYYVRLAANTEKPVGAVTPWKTWMLLISPHLDEAVYKAGLLDRPCVIRIGETGFQPVPL